MSQPNFFQEAQEMFQGIPSLQAWYAEEESTFNQQQMESDLELALATQDADMLSYFDRLPEGANPFDVDDDGIWQGDMDSFRDEVSPITEDDLGVNEHAWSLL